MRAETCDPVGRVPCKRNSQRICGIGGDVLEPVRFGTGLQPKDKTHVRGRVDFFEEVKILAAQSKDLRVAFTGPGVVKPFLLSFQALLINLQSVERQTNSDLV